MVRQRHPAVADTMISGLAEGPARCFEAIRRCANSLTDAGFELPSWTELANSQEVVFAEDPRAPRIQGGCAAESHQVSSPEVFGRTALDGAHGRRKGVDALPVGAFGVSGSHDDAHQPHDED